MAKATQYKKDKQAYAPSKGENFTGKSKTVPNEAFSVREMLIKHANGTMYDNVKHLSMKNRQHLAQNR